MELLAYIDDNPEEPGVKCLRIELSLSPAILVRFGLCREEKREICGILESGGEGALKGFRWTKEPCQGKIPRHLDGRAPTDSLPARGGKVTWKRRATSRRL